MIDAELGCTATLDAEKEEGGIEEGADRLVMDTGTARAVIIEEGGTEDGARVIEAGEDNEEGEITVVGIVVGTIGIADWGILDGEAAIALEDGE